MDLNMILAIICSAVAFVGVFCVSFQIYRMTVIDATVRGLKHPKLWGFFTISGHNASGLLTYLIRRRKYPIVHKDENSFKQLERCKKIAGIGLLFVVVGAIGLLCTILI